MILTCPECATRYFVPDDSVGPAGRTVRCANCGASWRAEPEAPLDLVPETVEEEGGAPEPPPPLTGEDLPRVFRERATAKRRAKRAMTKGAMGAAAGLGVIGLLTLAILGRNAIARAWPESASAFNAVGLPVNVVGLLIEEQKAEKGFEDGRPAMLVSGALRNVAGRPVRSPPLKLTLLNGEEEVVATKIATPEQPDIPAGQKRYFAVRVLDPPESVAHVDITFELGDPTAADAYGGGHEEPHEGASEASHEQGRKTAHGASAEPAHAPSGLRDRPHPPAETSGLRPAADAH